MSTNELTPTLMITTLVVVLIVAVVLLLRFLRKPSNRHPMEGEQERNIGQAIDEADGGPTR